MQIWKKKKRNYLYSCFVGVFFNITYSSLINLPGFGAAWDPSTWWVLNVRKHGIFAERAFGRNTLPKTGAEHSLTATRRRLAIAPRPHNKFLATYGIPTANVKTNQELLMTLDRRHVNAAGLGPGPVATRQSFLTTFIFLARKQYHFFPY